MSLPPLDIIDFATQLDAIYSDDPDYRQQIREGWGLEDLTISREEFEQALAALATVDVALVSHTYAVQANDFISVFNAYAAYMNG